MEKVLLIVALPLLILHGFQDLKHRMVNGILFIPLFVIAFIWHMNSPFLPANLIFNLSFTCILFVVLTLYVRLTRSEWNIINKFIGLGDFLYLIVVSFFLAAPQFVLFVLLSNIILIPVSLFRSKKYRNTSAFTVPVISGFSLVLSTGFIYTLVTGNTLFLTDPNFLFKF